jgi:hypothetical protein
MVVVGHDLSVVAVAVAVDAAAVDVTMFMVLSSLCFVSTATAALLPVPQLDKILSNIFGYNIDDGIVLVSALWIADGYFCKSV